ncbi:hypothetical protein TUM20903_19430 [Citrobacter koseri]|nr:hypothetical protein TUM13189_19640 [Citrobacter koseri]BDG89205.1 hypothetical protein TUM20903_19430 [Citrobacter koseri]
MGGYSDYNHRYTQFRPHFHDINGYAINKKSTQLRGFYGFLWPLRGLLKPHKTTIRR